MISNNKIIEKVELNLRKYLAMKDEVFPLVICSERARLHKIADNLIRIEMKPEFDM